MADELRAKRIERRLKDAPLDIAATLYGYHQAAIDGKYEWVDGDEPKAVLIIPICSGGPTVDWGGYVTKDDLRAVVSKLQDVIDPDRVRIREENERYYRERRDAYEKANPFPCSHPECSKRFETDTGRKIHERSCWRIKRDKAAGSDEA